MFLLPHLTCFHLLTGSPFKVPIEDVVDSSKVKLHGPGIESDNVRATVPTTFTVDCSDAGKAPLKVTVDDGQYSLLCI